MSKPPQRHVLVSVRLRFGVVGYWPDSSLSGALKIFDDPQALLVHWGGK